MRIVRTLSIIAGLAIALPVAPAHATPDDLPTLVDVRYAKHSGYDRIVFEFEHGTPEWQAGYGRLESQGTGDPIRVEGEATVVVTFMGATARSYAGEPTYQMRTLDPRLPALRQVRFNGEYEATIGVGLGVMDRVPFRSYALSSPPRVVVDLTHPRPFGTATVTRSGSASNVTVSGIRAGKHYYYDRFVLDVRGTAKPTLTVRYSGDTSLLLVRLSGAGTARFTGTSPVYANLPNLKRVRLGYLSGGTLIFRASTAARRGFRVQVLTSPVRVVVDVRH